MKLFFDTSAFLKRYVFESGSNDVENLCYYADSIGISILLPVEAIATFNRLRREKKISSKQYAQIKSAFFSDIRDISVLPIDPIVIKKSVIAIEKSPLKALDATHIGCALEYAPDYFVSSDKQQLIAAEKLGLKVKKII